LNELLVSKCLDVLDVFRAQNGQNLWVNEIVRRVKETTGSKDKPAIIKSIALLEDASMIQTLPVGEQKEVKILTPLGQEVSKFFSDIKQIHKSHSDLKKLIIEKFGIAEDLDETRIKNRLRSRGWSSDEILFYREFTAYARLLITESLSMIYSVLTYRYSALSLKYHINVTARLILDRIVLDALKYHISNSQDTETMRQLYYMKDNNEGTRIIMDRLQSSIVTMEQCNPHLNRFTDNEGARLLSSICGMLEVPKNVVEDYISEVKKEESSLKALGLEHTLKWPDSHYVMEGVKYWNPYKDTRRISNRILCILYEMLKKSS
jgi:hypothetical protein